MYSFWAHTPNAAVGIPEHLLKEHLRSVAQRAVANASHFSIPNVEPLLHVAGLLHDLGKYKLEFQRERLGYDPKFGKATPASGKRIDHSSMGAVVVYPGSAQPLPLKDALLALSRIIAAHHSGLSDAHAFEARVKERQHDPFRTEALNYAVAELPEMRDVNKQLGSLGLELPVKSQEFLTRMLLSCLVDADQTDTEAHCSPRKGAVRRRKLASLEELLTRLGESQTKFKLDTELNRLRKEMYDQASEAAELEPGFFRLTMPTGAGKTRTSLAFALKHALTHNLQRVVYAVPFTTIIDQTAQVFRSILNEEGEENVLEHHSALELGQLGEEETQLWAKLLTETWNAPLVVTTTVQLFESLFANKTSRIRKLHSVAGSVIVLDEVQSLPTGLLKPILDGLNELVTRYRVSVVLCTATQPALSAESGFDFPELQNVRDIVHGAEVYFKKLERVTYTLNIAEPTPWYAVAKRLGEAEQALCIVNLRRHARELFEQVREKDAQALHLSTHMFPAHRKQQLRLIRRRLRRGQPCRVVSTQLIECGVDVDFPNVFRALGPLDAIVQAAGRCNREGKLRDEQRNLKKGRVWVFKPEDAVTPKGDYFVKVQKAETMLKAAPDLNSHTVFEAYFRDVYERSDTDAKGVQKLREDLEFSQVAEKFRLIDSDTVPVVITGVSAEGRTFALKTARKLLRELEVTPTHIRRELWRELQLYSVNIFRAQLPKLSRYLRQIRLQNGAELDLYEWLGVYDIRMGIQLEEDFERFVF